MHGTQPYDPKKAHEYYMRTRKLKGRKKGQQVQSAPKQSAKATSSKGHEIEAFMKKLPIVSRGEATVEEAAALVKWAANHTDDEIKKEVEDTIAALGDKASGKVATLRQLMLMRSSNTKVTPAKSEKPKEKPEATKSKAYRLVQQ